MRRKRYSLYISTCRIDILYSGPHALVNNFNDDTNYFTNKYKVNPIIENIIFTIDTKFDVK